MATEINERRATIKKIHIAFAFSVAMLGLAIGALVYIPDGKQKTLLFYLYEPAIGMLACAALIFAINRTRKTSFRIALALGFLLTAQIFGVIGDVSWVYSEHILKTNPMVSMLNVFYVLRYPLILGMVLALPRRPFEPLEGIKRGLEIAIAIGAAMLVYWNFLFAPLLNVFGQTAANLRMYSSYAIGGLILLAALVSLIDRNTDQLSDLSFLMFVLSFMVMIVADFANSHDLLTAGPSSENLVDIGWIFSWLLIGLAAIIQGLSVTRKKGYFLFQKMLSRQVDLLRNSFSYIIYVYFFIAYLVLVQNYITPNMYSLYFNLVGVGCILALAVVLQIITHRENNTLYNRISTALGQTRQQSAELSKINHSLQIEVNERKRAEEQLSHDAMHDWLTGLPNRLLFSDRLERAIEYTQRRNEFPFAVFFLDLDHFKVINDSLGHHTGDQLLISVANRLHGCLRSSDTVARLGGDEFVMLVENPKGSDTISQVTVRILDELSKPILINGQELHITASIGVVMSVDGYQCPDDVLRDADIAMYQAKALGKARVEVFTPDLRSRAVSRLELENDMRQALEQGEFFLHYQPIIDLVSNQITGVEALVRWKHPRRGILLPMEFIPVAEETGLMIPLGKWILLEACAQLKQWQTSLPSAQKMMINVNISGRQLLQADFVETVRMALLATGLSPSSLKLEITETVLINNYEEANHKFVELNELGIQLEIDDFGTGYSSLSYLQHFPIHTIKIDKSFVHDMSISEKGSDLIRTMIMMARDMGMDAIAEGVETAEQLQKLQDLMCHYGQGYLLCKPIGAQEIEKYITNQALVLGSKTIP